jgi:3-deoxy-D-manno-octulosonic-acid transferase
MLIYRILMALALPFVLLALALRRKGPLSERLGLGVPPASGPAIWLHGASNGELASAVWVLRDVLAARPGLQVLVTVNTGTARAMVAGWGLPGVVAALAPLDTGGAVDRVLRRWQPRALVIIENELWPQRIAAARARGIPVLVIGARLSARSAARWGKVRRIMAQTLARVTWLSAQDQASLDRLRGLGLPLAAAGPVLALKAFGAGDPVPPPFAAPAPRARVLLAASTHGGEEALMLDAFAGARGQFDHLILAPRHPRRAAEIEALIRARGLAFAQRSKGAVPDAATPVHLADTMGEMDHWYAMAGVCIIGGTFADKGGHTPWEPARQGAAILHGPSVANFAAPFAALDAAGGAMAVTEATLTQALAGMDAARQAQMAAMAADVLRPQGDPAALVAAIVAAVPR